MFIQHSLSNTVNNARNFYKSPTYKLHLHKHHQITLHHSTVYNYLRDDKSNGGTLWQHLRICSKSYRKRYGSTWSRGKVPDRTGIENRPAIVDEKSRIGDWEADTIVGKDQKSALLTLVERVTRYTIICKLKNFKAQDTANAVIRALRAHKDRVRPLQNPQKSSKFPLTSNFLNLEDFVHEQLFTHRCPPPHRKTSRPLPTHQTRPYS